MKLSNPALWWLLPPASLLFATVLLWRSAEADAAQDGPAALRRSNYVGSGVCRRCHNTHYDSWHRTFHRSMTQEANADSVLGDFGGAVLRYGGRQARMEQRADGRFVMRFQQAGDDTVEEVVERTVGSHRYQQYLTRRDDRLLRLPLAWNVEEARWFHMNEAFLTPDPPELGAGALVPRQDYERHVTRWNDNCIYCHNTAPRAGLSDDGEHFDSDVAELGIACEACHGPGSRHARSHQNPVRRYLQRSRDEADRSIANPERMSAERSSQVCGRCHGQRITSDIQRLHRVGDRFIPGEDLGGHSRPLTRDTTLNGKQGVFALRFWPDGTPRLTAYEYQGLLMSPCAQAGELHCESCHDMHDGPPAGQLAERARGDGACTACHSDYAGADASREHSHHASDGPGGRCVACHMPPIVYGLVGARISHRIEVPDATASADRPDACTLCHVGRSRAWAGCQQRRLWGAGGATLECEQSPPAAPWLERAVLGGDPIERSLAAAALGRATDGDGQTTHAMRLGLLLEVLAGDDYPAVRAIAWRALSRLQPGALLNLDRDAAVTGSHSQRQAQVQELVNRLGMLPIQRPAADRVALLRQQAMRVAIEIGE